MSDRARKNTRGPTGSRYTQAAGSTAGSGPALATVSDEQAWAPAPEELIDIGANLVNRAFRDDLDAVLDRAARGRVTGIVVTGTNLAVSRRAWEMAQGRAPGNVRLWSTAGVHPHHAATFGPDALTELRELAARPEVVALGECGLDYDRDFAPRPDQRRCFDAQLELAAELGMPVFLHERSAHGDFLAMLRAARPRLTRAVVHCFTGTRTELEHYLDLDLHIGITGWICDERRGTHLREIVSSVPDAKLMVETDAPYLLPRDIRPPSRNRNEPALLPHVVRKIAACRRQPEDVLARATTLTALDFFAKGERTPTAQPSRRS